MCDQDNKNDKNNIEDSKDKGDEDMAKVAILNIPENRKTKVYSAIKEVKMIRSEKLPRKSARDFLKESRSNSSK